MATRIGQVESEVLLDDLEPAVQVAQVVVETLVPTNPRTADDTVRIAEYRALTLSKFDVAYWRLGESAGTTAADEVAGHDGTYGGGVTLGEPGAQNGDENTAARFDGASGTSVQVPAWAGLDAITNGLSVAAWVKVDPADSNNRIVRRGAGGHDWWLTTANGGGHWLGARVYTQAGAAFANLASQVDYADGQFHLLGLTYDGTTARLYVDGVEKDSEPLTGDVYHQVGAVGIGSYGGAATSENFEGVIDEVAIASRALTAQEWADLWSADNDITSEVYGAFRTAEDTTAVGDGPNGRIDYSRALGDTVPTTDAVDEQVNRLRSATDDVSDTGAIAYHQRVLQDSPVHYWRLTEPTGGFADSADALGASEFGTITRGIIGPVEDAAAISGAGGGYLTLPGFGDFPVGQSPRSIEFWYRGTSTARQTIVSYGSQVQSRFFSVAVNQDGVSRIGVWCWFDDGSVSAPGLLDGNWHHIVVTKADGANVTKFYMDGLFLGSFTHLQVLDTGLAHLPTIGADAHVGANMLNGSLDEVAIYGVELGAGRIAFHAGIAAGGDQPNRSVGYHRTVTDTRSTSDTILHRPGVAKFASDSIPFGGETLTYLHLRIRRPVENIPTTDSLVSVAARPFNRRFDIGGFGVQTWVRAFDVGGAILPIEGTFRRVFDVGDKRMAGTFVRAFDIAGLLAGSFTRRFDVFSAVAPVPGGVLPPPAPPVAGVVLTADAAAGDAALAVNDTDGLVAGALVNVGGELRILSSVDSSTSVTLAAGLGSAHVSGTALTVEQQFVPQAIWVFDKGGSALGAITRYALTTPRRFLINGIGDMAFSVPRTEPSAALIRGDRLVAVESVLGLPTWAGVMEVRSVGDGSIAINCPDAMSLLTDLPVKYEQKEDVPAWTLAKILVDLANAEKAKVGDIQIEFEGSGSQLSYGDYEHDGDPYDGLRDLASNTNSEFHMTAEVSGGSLHVGVVFSDRFEASSGALIRDGVGGNVVARPRYVDDQATRYNAVSLRGLAADIAECLPDWAAWVAEDLIPEVYIERDPGDARRRVTLNAKVGFGISQATIATICDDIQNQLTIMFESFLYAYHDQFGQPFHPGWRYEGPPENIENFLHTGLNWRTRRRFITYQDQPASAVMRSQTESQLLITLYDRITGIQTVRRVFFNEAGPGGVATVMLLRQHGWAYRYDTRGGVIIGRAYRPYDHSRALVTPETVTLAWPRRDPAGHFIVTYHTLRRVVSLAEDGSANEGDYFDLDPANGPTDGSVQHPDGGPAFTRPTVGDAPYREWTLTTVDAGIEYDAITHIWDFERARIWAWDPRRDGVGVQLNKTTVVDNAPTTSTRWHIVPWGVGGERQTVLLTGISADGTQLYVESAWEFMNQPVPFTITVGIEPGAEDMIVTAMSATLWTVTRGANGTTAIIHEPGEPVVLKDGGDFQPGPGLGIVPTDPSWPEGENWANALLDRLMRGTPRLSVSVINRLGIWQAVDYGTVHSASLTLEDLDGVTTSARVIGFSPDEFSGEMELLLDDTEVT